MNATNEVIKLNPMRLPLIYNKNFLRDTEAISMLIYLFLKMDNDLFKEILATS